MYNGLINLLNINITNLLVRHSGVDAQIHPMCDARFSANVLATGWTTMRERWWQPHW
jgi:hypothetical protein